MKILAIETSCDETAISLLEANGGLAQSKFKIIKSLVASQIKIHQPFGGVVPNLAKREHLKNLPIIWRRIAKRAELVDLIAVTVGPGLEPALWTGINFAEKIYQGLKVKNKNLKIIGVNHLEGHLYSFLLPQKSEIRNQKSDIRFPAVHLLVSGGHTILLLLKNLKTIKKLGETRDDAVGECFDKVARLLKLLYPGGPEVEKLAKKGNSQAINFPRPMLDQKNYDFSFSGLKTSVLYYLRDSPGANRADVAASFQKAALDVLIKKTIRAAEEYGAKTIIVSGGVAANKELRARFKKEAGQKFSIITPALRYCTDNADMIGAAAYASYLRGKAYKLEAKGDLSI